MRGAFTLQFGSAFSYTALTANGINPEVLSDLWGVCQNHWVWFALYKVAKVSGLC